MVEKNLASIYLDLSQPANFGLDAVQGENDISRKDVQHWLSQQDVYTLHYWIKLTRESERSRVIVHTKKWMLANELFTRFLRDL